MLKIISAFITLGILNVSAAQAAEIPDLEVTCYDRATISDNIGKLGQRIIDQYNRDTPSGPLKTSVTGYFANGGLVDGGRGYVIETRGEQACILTKTRIDYGPKENQFTVSWTRTFGKMELTVPEWQHVAKYAKDNDAEIQKKMKDGTLGKSPKQKVKIPRGSYEADFLYEIVGGKVTPIKRGRF